VAHPSQFHHEGWVAVAFVVIFAVAFAFLLSSFAEGGGPAFSFVFVLAVVLAFLDVHEKSRHLDRSNRQSHRLLRSGEENVTKLYPRSQFIVGATSELPTIHTERD
jgi:hypothetical protein